MTRPRWPLLIAALVIAAALGPATAGAAFRYMPDYPGGPILVGNPAQVAKAVKACQARVGCYRAVTPLPAFRRDCQTQHVGPRKLARRLQAHSRGAVFVRLPSRWLCRPYFPEEVVF